jgi:hypothetical protein
MGLLRASRRRGFAKVLAKLAVLFDERSETRLPQDVGKARVAVHLMVALDQAPALPDQVARQKTEIEVFDPM